MFSRRDLRPGVKQNPDIPDRVGSSDYFRACEDGGGDCEISAKPLELKLRVYTSLTAKNKNKPGAESLVKGTRDRVCPFVFTPPCVFKRLLETVIHSDEDTP